MNYKKQLKVIKLNKKIDGLEYKASLKRDEVELLEEQIASINEELNEKQTKKIEKNKQKQVRRKEKLEVKRFNKLKHRKMNEPPVLSTLEEIGNAITHGVGAILAIVAIVLMLLKSDTSLKITASLVYGISIFFMMLASCLYHSFKKYSTVKRVFRRFDYSSIYLLIGGTFAPLFLVYWGNTLGIVLFIIQWVAIITGITMVGVFGPGRLRWLHYPLYFVIGWSGIMFIPGWIEHDLGLLFYVLGGGIVYTLGMIPFVKRGVKAAHFIWHFFVLAGCIVQFLGIYLYVF